MFLAQRSNDPHLNARVSVFLRELERYDGILFLTTNRVQAFDEATISRMAAGEICVWWGVVSVGRLKLLLYTTDGGASAPSASPVACRSAPYGDADPTCTC